MNQTSRYSIDEIVAFINSHDAKVVSHTDTTITAKSQVRSAEGVWSWEEETFPATAKDARFYLGY